MPNRSTKTVTLAFVMAGLALAVVAGRLQAHSNGVSGKASSPTGCSCHGAASNGNGNVVVDILGPTALAPGASGHFTLTVSGDPAGTTGGVDVHASGGMLMAGIGMHVAGGDMVHSDNTRRSWSFDWQAPMTEGGYNLQAIAMADNNDGSSDGDSWNWFGGVAGTPFAITVSQAVDADPIARTRLELEAPYPNPSRGQARVTFTLPRDARVSLDLLDVRGRKEAVLVSGVIPAGRHTILWDARDFSGNAAPAGVYWIRLTTGQATLTQRWMLVR